ncbi:winged helix-turn-helix domain-containing protein [Actinoallomurus purpureus]|uniref:ArsR/SmtB family transcription factor n=1 Tax=Actinoallomurus purpureus TaxID=478114 RepID=UPI002092AAC8|nr:winged helix-turn-helix domain-containing protein [Actinoallomurus purpureus]MCO6006224.1 winged helix-turn-helix domain-containing protein [Actinoallomurus purpureus]
MLRVHFTGEDLSRTLLSAGPDPLWDVLLSLHQLPGHDGALTFGPWRRQVRAELPPSLRWLGGLAPPRGYSPDFLTPGADGLEHGLDLIASTPLRVIRQDLRILAVQQRSRAPARGLADGSAAAMRGLVDALRRYHQVALAPFTRRIERSVRTDVAARGRTLQHAGIEGLFVGLHHQARWRPPVLELPYPVDRDVRLEGRGLRLVPSFFCWKYPIVLRDPERTPVLVFPLERDFAWSVVDLRSASPRSLEALLGRTRASILSTVATRACSTSELAARVGVSKSMASQHATVLRDAGLITTHRIGRQVMHSSTAAADTLLESAS